MAGRPTLGPGGRPPRRLALRAPLRAKAEATPWLQLALCGDTWTWTFDSGHYDGFWDDSPLLDLAHGLQIVAQHRARIPSPSEVSAS